MELLPAIVDLVMAQFDGLRRRLGSLRRRRRADRSVAAFPRDGRVPWLSRRRARRQDRLSNVRMVGGPVEATAIPEIVRPRAAQGL